MRLSRTVVLFYDIISISEDALNQTKLCNQLQPSILLYICMHATRSLLRGSIMPSVAFSDRRKINSLHINILG